LKATFGELVRGAESADSASEDRDCVLGHGVYCRQMRYAGGHFVIMSKPNG
jgi:hypothetical protein